MQVGVYGAGYLGTIVSACIADFGIPVTTYDEDRERLSEIAQGNVPFFEKSLKDLIKRNVRSARLVYSRDFESFTSRSQLLFLAEDNHNYLEEIAVRIAKQCGDSGHKFLVIATPSPVGTARRIEKRIAAEKCNVTIVSHPLFLTNGCAVEDFNWPDRIVLGTSSSDAVMQMKQLYRPLVMRGVPVIVTNHETAELVREASTAFVATKISFINELASLCEHVDADAVDLALALGLDKKIAPRCLQPGNGFGGQFAEHDMDSLAQLAISKDVSLKVLSAAREVNRRLTERIVEKLGNVLTSVHGKEIGVLGLAFKPNTNSVAASSSIQLVKDLLRGGARVRAYDPVAIPDAKVELNGTVQYFDSPYAMAEGVDALVLSTGWPEFRTLDYDRIKRMVRKPVLLDTKNLLDGMRMRAMGFQYVGIGRSEASLVN